MLPRAATVSTNWQYDHLVAQGFRRGSSLLFPNRYIVNLRLSDEAQRKSFEQKWRYHLNKADKAGLSFERGGAERADEFDALYHAMADRKNFPDHSAYDTIPALFGAETGPRCGRNCSSCGMWGRGRRRRHHLQGGRYRGSICSAPPTTRRCR